MAVSVTPERGSRRASVAALVDRDLAPGLGHARQTRSGGSCRRWQATSSAGSGPGAATTSFGYYASPGGRDRAVHRGSAPGSCGDHPSAAQRRTRSAARTSRPGGRPAPRSIAPWVALLVVIVRAHRRVVGLWWWRQRGRLVAARAAGRHGAATRPRRTARSMDERDRPGVRAGPAATTSSPARLYGTGLTRSRPCCWSRAARTSPPRSRTGRRDRRGSRRTGPTCARPCRQAASRAYAVHGDLAVVVLAQRTGPAGHRRQSWPAGPTRRGRCSSSRRRSEPAALWRGSVRRTSRGARACGRLARHQRRVDVLEDDLAGDDDPGDVLAATAPRTSRRAGPLP